MKTPEQIQSECENMYAQIRNAETELRRLRELCKHEITYVGEYSWRPGAHHKAHICAHCLHPVKFIDL